MQLDSSFKHLNLEVALRGRYSTLWPILYFVTSVTLLVFLFRDGLAYMLSEWEYEEYSHGYMIPLISIYFILQNLPKLENISPKNTGIGFAIFASGLVLFMVGELSSLYSIIHYAFIICIAGLFATVVGTNGLNTNKAAFIYLLFMIPIPHFLHFALSAKLQLISSELGVFILRLFNVSVFLEGNVIDLGAYQLQVVEACSGLRYLFPLMSFGFLIACIYRSPLWFKAVLFLSTIPITVFMNSFRISVIGVTVDRWGTAAAEGFIHDFEGWVVFMACVSLLFLQIAIYHRLTNKGEYFGEKLDVFLPSPLFSERYAATLTKVRTPQILAALTLLAFFPLHYSTEARNEQTPERLPFSRMSLAKQGWHGIEKRIDVDTEAVLKFTDYTLSDFKHLDYQTVTNFYVAYYDSQRKGASIHSPKTCIPGGGWEISSLTTRDLDIQATSKEKLSVNRAVIQKGRSRSLVYYWFQQRGRVITNEYAAKWYIFWDALTLNRTDGALVRVTTDWPSGIPESEMDKKLTHFISSYMPVLAQHVPE